MPSIYLISAILIIVVVLTLLCSCGCNKKKWNYIYKRRDFFLTRAEHEFYDCLIKAVDSEYVIFAQVHLTSLLIPTQNWRVAFRHVNQKSVDFVLCDKKYLSPKLVIELDDKSHDRSDRQARDQEVERLLKSVGIPLLRIRNQGRFSSEEIFKEIKNSVLIES